MRVLERLLCLALICALLAIPTFTALADGEDDPAEEASVEETKAENAGESAKPEKSAEKKQSSEDSGKAEDSSKAEAPAKAEESTKAEETSKAEDSVKAGEKSESEKPAESETPVDTPATPAGEADTVDEKPAEAESEPAPDVSAETGDAEEAQSTPEVVETGDTDVPEGIEDTPVEEPADTGNAGTAEEAAPEGDEESQQPEEQPETQEPSPTEPETPEAEPDEEDGEAAPEDEAIDLRLTLSITEPQGLPQADGAYQVDPERVSQLTFAWKCDGQCNDYEVQISGGLYSGSTEETSLTLSTASLPAGRYTVTVEAVLDGKAAAQAALVFAVLSPESEAGDGTDQEIPEEGEKPEDGKMPGGGGFPGGGRPSGSRSGGKRSGGGQGGEEGQEEQGFTVTAGQALTSAHSSGSKDMALYGTVVLSVDADSPMSALTLDGVALDITLDEGREAFTAALVGSAITLTPHASGTRWTLNGYALKTLARSGIDRLYLALEDEVVPFPTQPALNGDVYSALCAAGYASGDYDYTVSPDGVEVSVDGMDYTLSDDGELIGARS